MRQIDAEQLEKVAFKPDIESAGLVRKSYLMELLTPLFGGDTESWKPNTDRPIRVPAIKGQLRFWWRTTQDAATPAELLEKEGAVWGKTGKSAPLGLQIVYRNKPSVAKLPKSQVITCTEYPPYVLFPLQGQKDRSDFDVVEACAFELHVSCEKDVWQEVERTLKLWVLFGGVGARTRRGAGSLYCPELTAGLNTPEQIAGFLKSCCAGQTQAFGTAAWPRLAGSRLAFAATGERQGCAAWKAFLDSYGDFRQKPGVGRGPGHANHPGRSYWPEPDALRRITGHHAPNHAPEHPAGNWFPRAAFGMPVQTEFRNASGDPDDKYMLQPKGRDRWPSPVVLKIVRPAKGGPLFKCALILNAAIPAQLEIKEGKNRIMHPLAANEMPMATQGKSMPKMPAFAADRDPYSALIRHLKVKEVL